MRYLKSMPPGDADSRVRVPWDEVDLTRPTVSLMREFGVTRQAVRAARKVRGIPSPERRTRYAGPREPLPLDDDACRILLALSAAAKIPPSDLVRRLAEAELSTARSSEKSVSHRSQAEFHLRRRRPERVPA